MENILDTVPKNTKEIVAGAASIYEEIKEERLEKEKGVYNLLDKKCLSLFLSLLKNDEQIKNLFLDYDIDYEKLLDIFDIEDTNKKGNADEFNRLLILLEDHNDLPYSRALTPVLLLSKLQLKEDCGSDFIKDIYQKLDFTDNNLSSTVKNLLELEWQENLRKLEEKSRAKKNVQPAVIKPMTEEKLDFTLGRNDEVRKILISLLEDKKSVLLTGPSGTGKTSLVKGVAHKMLIGDVPSILNGKTVFSLDVASLVSGCKYIGMFEEKLTTLLNNLDHGEIIFIDDVHSVVGAGKGLNSANDMANILKPYLDSGKIKIIGTTTDEDYEKYLKDSTAFKRRFDLIKIDEPGEEDLKGICLNYIIYLEDEHKMLFMGNILSKLAIISKLIKLTKMENRNYREKRYNPDLILSIISRSFATATYFNRDTVTESDVYMAVEDNETIYNHAKIKMLKPSKKSLKKDNIIKIDF